VIHNCDLAGENCNPKFLVHSEILPGNKYLSRLGLGPSDVVIVQPRYGSRELATALRPDRAALTKTFGAPTVDNCIDALDEDFGNVQLSRIRMTGRPATAGNWGARSSSRTRGASTS
jgi:hypothetical protein